MAHLATPARRTLYNDPTFSDIKIRQIYKGKVKEYAAHKAVLCAHSGWFMAALTGRFKEASADTIEVHDDDPETFQNMMEFFYGLDLERTPTSDNENEIIRDDIVPIVELHALADKYDANLLQKAAVVAFKAGTDELVSLPDWKSFEMLVNAHYLTCPGTMGAMSQAIVKYMYRISRSYFLWDGYFDKLAAKHGNFGADSYLVGRAGGKIVFN
ncbi:hypothetical protein J4E83_009213 [Alternaria metachromatica]|uniref:uncharacterized protein n=1 Tax=Alternaria metachromatica TaxID=283354 RepID=UPI0020C3E096|nr:uncharacterized protein J4E83_009213 [Alternaria metachromatica]KAI4608030.1 hypothetical protein J4E83_009213 [Alternaria metachromatica]